MLTITSALEAAQRASRRLPILAVSIRSERFAVPFYPFEPATDDGSGDFPHDAAYSPDADAYARIRLNGTALQQWATSSPAWATLDTVSAGQGFAIRYDTAADLFTLVYADGNDLKLRTSADGASWSSSTTLLTEASPIGPVALAIETSGNACAFYVLGTSSTLKRLRRTSGSWAASGTTWSKTASVASLTGLSAVWGSEYYLALTGTEATTTHPRCWIVAMGDTVLPANAWSGLIDLGVADADSGVSFAAPHIALDSAGNYFATFVQTSDDSFDRPLTLLTSTNADLDPLSDWREPYPFPTGDNGPAFGVALVPVSTTQLDAFGPSTYHPGYRFASLDQSARVLTCSWRETVDSLRVRLELDNTDGLAALTGAEEIRAGLDLVIQHGLTTPSGDAYGTTLRANIDRIVRRYDNTGRQLVIIEASGPWEQLARYRAPTAWTAPAGATRADVFRRVAGRAGLSFTEASADFAPTGYWSLEAPFAIVQGETAATTMRRLLAPTPDLLRLDGATGGLQIWGLIQWSGGGFHVYASRPATDPDAVETADEGGDGAGVLPVLSFEKRLERLPNWRRVQAKSWYADAFAVFDIAPLGEPLPTEPLFDVLRVPATDDQDETVDYALASLRRDRMLGNLAELVTPAHTGVELGDLAQVFIANAGGDSDDRGGIYRVFGRGLDFRRGPGGPPAFNTTLHLGAPFWNAALA